MRMTTTSILMALTLVAGMSAANAQIASKQYVDDRETAILTGSGTAQEKAEAYEEVGITSSDVDDVSDAIDTIGVAGTVAGFRNSFFTVADQLGVAIGEPSDLTTDEQRNLVGAINEVNSAVGNVETAVGDVETALDGKVNTTQFVNNAIMVTNNSGNVGMQTGNFINDDFIQSAGVSLDKLILPSVPAACSATGGSCVLMYVGGTGYVWEVVSRDSNETISTTGSVTGTSTGIHPDFTAATGVVDELPVVDLPKPAD